MSFICTNDNCTNVDEEVGTKEWERQMRDNDISESDMEKLEAFVNDIYNMN